MAYQWNDLCQSELVDFEGEKDSEEDAKKEKEKENKILEAADLLAKTGLFLPANGRHDLNVVSAEIQEVLSPPPDRL